MQRDIDRLTAQTFDVLIVGGGIYGLTVAYDAAQRGLTVALIERQDFGSGSSFNHLRTIHGGLRYLQTLDIARARESIRERRTLARIASSTLVPLPFVLPLSRSLTRGKIAMRAGLALDRIISRDRNDRVPPSHQLPSGYVLGRAEAIRRFPMLSSASLDGAAVWHDYVTTDADRLTLAWGLGAAAHGAVLANYVEACGLRIESGRVVGVSAVDRRSGRGVELGARTVVNATGAAIDRLLTPAGLATGQPMLKAMNLVTRLEAPGMALGGRSSSGRNLFMVPIRGRALFGTWESPQPSGPEERGVNDREVADFIKEVNHAFPSFGLKAEDVTLVHRGIVPALLRPDGSATLEGQERIHDHRAAGLDGLITVAGTKYTTARAVAERITDAILVKLDRPEVPCRTAGVPLPLSSLTGDALLREAASHEMVVTLEDAVIRRTSLGAFGHPGQSALGHAAVVVGDVLGWDDARRATEIESVDRFYR